VNIVKGCWLSMKYQDKIRRHDEIKYEYTKPTILIFGQFDPLYLLCSTLAPNICKLPFSSISSKTEITARNSFHSLRRFSSSCH
jgi:hypothetical protein